MLRCDPAAIALTIAASKVAVVRSAAAAPSALHYRYSALTSTAPAEAGRCLSAVQELDRVLVGRAHERHVAVARQAVNGDTRLHQLVEGRVDVVDLIGEAAEMARLALVLGVRRV